MRLFLTSDSILFEKSADLKWFLDQIELELLSIARSVGVDLKQEEWKNAEDSPPFYKNNALRKLSLRDPSA
jgi:hypothetical protein